MALVTDQLITTETALVQVTYDDVTLDLSQVRVVCTETVVFRVHRMNGAAWKNVTLEAGEYVYPLPAGPVRTLDDIPFFGLVV